MPVYAHKKAWQRVNDSLIELSQSRLSVILDESSSPSDWSSNIVPEATIDDLDPKAIALAREKYKKLYPSKVEEVNSWDDAKFLNKTSISIKGKMTKSAIIILGREESEPFIAPSVCRIRWRRKKESGGVDDGFKIFTIPMIIAVEEIGRTIKNAEYVYTVEGSMFPESMLRYDVFTLREPINNAIAHQDYSKCSMIDIVEYEDDKLVFSNKAHFIPESIEKVVTEDIPESFYRNRRLVEVMRNVKMVETQGGGIKKLFSQQKKRFFPMPEYELADNQVTCIIAGNVLNETFARLLVNNPDLSLPKIMLLDSVQKGKAISDDSIKLLRNMKYIEGRKPHIYLSCAIVENSKHIGLKTSYIKNKGFNDDYYKNLIINYISKFGKASRKEIDELLLDKLSDTLSERQKYDKVTNLLSSLKRKKLVRCCEGRIWELVR